MVIGARAVVAGGAGTMLAHALSTATLARLSEKSAPAPARECFHGRVIEHSDRTVDNLCTGTLNDTCEYQCQAGYIARGTPRIRQCSCRRR